MMRGWVELDWTESERSCREQGRLFLLVDEVDDVY